MRSNWIFLREEIWNRVYLSLKLQTRDEPHRPNGSFVSRIGKPWNNALARHKAVPLFRKWHPETVYGGNTFLLDWNVPVRSILQEGTLIKNIGSGTKLCAWIVSLQKTCCKNQVTFFYSELWHCQLKQVTDPSVDHFHIRWKDSACLMCLQGLGGGMITWLVVLRSLLRNTTAQESVLTTSGSKHRTRLLLYDLISFQGLSWQRMTSSHSFSPDGHLWMSRSPSPQHNWTAFSQQGNSALPVNFLSECIITARADRLSLARWSPRSWPPLSVKQSTVLLVARAAEPCWMTGQVLI